MTHAECTVSRKTSGFMVDGSLFKIKGLGKKEACRRENKEEQGSKESNKEGIRQFSKHMPSPACFTCEVSTLNSLCAVEEESVERALHV